MTIDKGKLINFSPPVAVTINFDGSTEGIEFNGIVAILREEDNTIILSRSDGSRLMFLNKYFFLEVKAEEE